MTKEMKKKKSTAERTVEKTLNQKKRELKQVEHNLKQLGKQVDDFYKILEEQQEVEEKMKKEAELLGRLKQAVIQVSGHQNKLELEVTTLKKIADEMITKNDELEASIEKKQSILCPMCINPEETNK